jgi:hypothetical protein
VIERPRLVRDEELGVPPPASPSPGPMASSSGTYASASVSSSAPISRAATLRTDDGWLEHAPTPERPSDPVGAALWDALERGSRRAAVAALHELLDRKERDEDLLPVWNEIAALGIPQGLKLGDLIDACALTKL